MSIFLIMLIAVNCWNGLFHINKLKMVCTLYKLLEPFFSLLYGFGMTYISLVYEVHADRVFLIIY